MINAIGTDGRKKMNETKTPREGKMMIMMMIMKLMMIMRNEKDEDKEIEDEGGGED